MFTPTRWYLGACEWGDGMGVWWWCVCVCVCVSMLAPEELRALVGVGEHAGVDVRGEAQGVVADVEGGRGGFVQSLSIPVLRHTDDRGVGKPSG